MREWSKEERIAYRKGIEKGQKMYGGSGMSITAEDNTASFVTGVTDKTDQKILEAKRKIAFASGHHLNLRNIVEVDVSGTWWRIFTADGKFHLVDPAKVNYASIA